MSTRRARWICLLPGVLAVAGAPGVASAQPRRPPATRPPAATPPAATPTGPAAVAATPPPADPTMADARRAYTEGTEHFNAGRFAEALASFERAFAMRANPVVLKPIAECHERLGHVPEAIAALERYLRELPTSPDHAQLEARLLTLRQRPARVSVTSSTEGAQITVDGEPRPQRTPAAVEVAPGHHRIGATLPGYRATEQELDASPGAPATVSIALERDGAAVSTGPGAGPETPPPTTRPRRTHPAVWVATAVAGAAAVAGTVFGVMALSDANDYEATPSQEALDRGQRNALLSDVGFGVAVLSAGVAVVVYFADRGRSEAPAAQASDGPRVRLAGNGLQVTF